MQPEGHGQKPCKNGDKCQHWLNGTCRFFHPYPPPGNQQQGGRGQQYSGQGGRGRGGQGGYGNTGYKGNQNYGGRGGYGQGGPTFPGHNNQGQNHNQNQNQTDPILN
jgi:hypothetical protein